MIQPPSSAPSAGHLADWTELEVMFGDAGVFSFGEAMRMFEDRFGDNAPDDGQLEEALLAEEADADDDDPRHDQQREAAAEGLSAAEDRWNGLLATLEFRRQVVGPAYPIELEGNAVVIARTWAADPVYAFLALVAARLHLGLAAAIGHHTPAKLFERVVAVALGNYVGGVGHRFGWPRLDGDPIEDFPAKVRTLARRMGEHVGGMRNVGPDDKDHRLDVIAWRTLADSVPEEPTPGQTVIVCQCGIGSDWNDKVLASRVWEKIIDFSVPPLAALAFPTVPSRDDPELQVWHDIASSGSIPFDRLRIASLVDSQGISDDLRSEMSQWIAASRAALPRVEETPHDTRSVATTGRFAAPAS